MQKKKKKKYLNGYGNERLCGGLPQGVRFGTVFGGFGVVGMRVVSVSKNGVGALLKNGERALKDIEKTGGVKLAVGDDSVTVEGEPEKEWVVEKVLEALSYGFHPKKALRLFSDDFFLETIDLGAALRGKGVERYKARIIGTRGRAKRTIEELSGASLAVGADSVAVLGRFDEIHAAKEAVLRLLEGATHSTVYGFMERLARNKKRSEMR